MLSELSAVTPSELSVSFPMLSEANHAVNSKLVRLADGTDIDLKKLNVRELEQLQCDQEPEFARRIVRSTKGSQQRAEVIRHAYETVCGILNEIDARRDPAESFAMGMDDRYAHLVLRLLADSKSDNSGLFELGFGSGILLETASKAGYSVGGLEVAEPLWQQAKSKLPPAEHHRLLLGDFLSVDLEPHIGKYSVAYWNDVFEHIPVDEIDAYLARLRTILRPGGKLVTITPNWHMRPSDVTKKFKPPRSEAIGFHLKEYTLGEIRSKLRSAGFTRVETPSFISLRQIYTSPWLNLTKLKVGFEPCLEFLPYRAAVQVCRRLGFNCTIATV